MDRRVAGEGATKAHDDASGNFDGSSVPMRRWEDWERSRLRKLKREEKRRREMERAYPRGFPADPMAAPQAGFLRPGTTFSDDGHWESDTVSVVSSNDDDQWGAQIGGYNEHGTMFPPPPHTLNSPSMYEGGETLGKDELEAMLDQGFDDPPPLPPLPGGMTQTTQRFQLTDGGYGKKPGSNNGYTQVGSHHPPPPQHVTSPVSPTVSPDGTSSAVDGANKTHVKKRSAGGKNMWESPGGRRDDEDYGPLGPLGPSGSSRRVI